MAHLDDEQLSLLAQYPVVDISHEPYEGDPAHSADSIARGVLTLQG